MQSYSSQSDSLNAEILIFLLDDMGADTVLVENGKIAQIGDLQPREGEDVRSAAGLYVLPGLVDIHIHAYAGADCMRGEDDVRRMSEGLLKTGVAAFMPTTMSAPNSTSDTGSPSKACTD